MKAVIWLLDRFVPTLLMGASAALLTAGVLSYAPSAFGEWHTPAPTVGGDPLFESPNPDISALETEWPSSGPSGQPSALPTDQPPTGGPTAFPTQSPPDGPTNHPTTQPTPPNGSPRPTVGPTGIPVPSGNSPATRIVIPSLDVDLPVVPSDLVVKGNVGFYPLCDVVMYMVGFVNPGQAGTTYIYGHAQDGMFAPLLHASKYNDGASMLGALVQVYTDDSKVHLYEISRVKRHSIDWSITRVGPGEHQLVLQTSEGWGEHLQKLQVAAKPITVMSASYAAAHPTPHPRVCLPPG